MVRSGHPPGADRGLASLATGFDAARHPAGWRLRADEAQGRARRGQSFSEYVDIAKAFYVDDEPKLVNAVARPCVPADQGRGPLRRQFALSVLSTAEARRNAVVLSVSQAVVGSAAPITIFARAASPANYLLGADKALCHRAVTGFTIGVAVGALQPPP